MTGIMWHRLDPNTIEHAIKLLLLDLHPGLRPIDGRGGDGGRDVRWDSPNGLAIFEIKSFAGERLQPAQRREIQRSLSQACKHAPSRWILVMPLDHSPAEERWFDSLAEQCPATRLEWWGLSWLNLEFGKREYLRRLTEGEAYELLTLAREFGQEHLMLTSPAQAITRIQRLVDRAQSLSAHWRLDFYTSLSGVGVVYSPRFMGSEPLGGSPPTPRLALPDESSASPYNSSATDDLAGGPRKSIMGKEYLHWPRVLDASALVALFSGNPFMMFLLDEADKESVLLLRPALAITEAQEIVAAPPTAWEFIFGITGVLVRDLTSHIAVKVSSMNPSLAGFRNQRFSLAERLTTAHVLHEATTMNAVIVTEMPQSYDGHDVAISILPGVQQSLP